MQNQLPCDSSIRNDNSLKARQDADQYDTLPEIHREFGVAQNFVFPVAVGY